MEELRDRDRIEALLRREEVWAGYALGDLDDAQFARTRWFSADDALVLRYEFGGHVTALTFGAADAIARVFAQTPLPEGFHLHLPHYHRAALRPLVEGELGAYLRLAVREEELEVPDCPRGVRARLLEASDVPRAEALYAAHYPGNWFDAQRVAEGCYLGLWEGEELVAAGGTHVVSGQYRIAALGDIVAAPAQRGRGLGSFLTAELCRRLFGEREVELVVLNVKEDNPAAQRAYAKVGFGRPVPHDEGFGLRRA